MGESYKNKKDLQIAHLARQLKEANDKLWVYANLELAVVPDGMGFKEYFEMLELKIEKFKEFIRHEKFIAYRGRMGFDPENPKKMVCRFCNHPFDPDNSREDRVSPSFHYGSCPLSVALQK